MIKIRGLVHDEDLISCVISDSSEHGRSFAILFQMDGLKPASEIPEGCRGAVRKALPAIRSALTENRVPPVSAGRSATLSVG